MAAGVALSVHMHLGVSPESAIPYTMTCVWGIEKGDATIVFHFIQVILQIMILRNRYRPINLLQIPVGIVFGRFTTFCNMVAGTLPEVHSLTGRLGLLMISIVLIAVGIFFYVPAKIMPLAGEGIMEAISEASGKPFHEVKVDVDVSVVCISACICILCLDDFGSVGVGTIIAAVGVGKVLGVLTRLYGDWRMRFLFLGIEVE